MEYVTRNGRRRRVHKEYVGVVVRLTDEGRVDPLAVLWPDGRVFRIDEVIERGRPGPMRNGVDNARYRVRFGRHETELYLEHRRGVEAFGECDTLRWWVFAADSTLPGSAG